MRGCFFITISRMKKLFLLLFIFSTFALHAQYSRLSGLNLSHFSSRQLENETEIKEQIPSRYFSHPDLGIFPYSVQKKNSLIELIDKRTSDSRYFIERGSGGKKFMIQKSFTPINYLDGNGWMREINYRLSPTTSPEVFSASQQRSPITIDIGKHEVTIFSKLKKLSLAKDIRLVHIDNSGIESEIGKANWSNYSAGDEGIIIYDFYPNVDLVFSVRESKIETDFVIKQQLNLGNGYLVMKQKFSLSNDLKFTPSNQLEQKEHYIIDTKNNLYFTIEKCYAFSNDVNNTAFPLTNSIDSSGELSVFTPVDWLNSPSTIYPVVIDPIVTAADSLLAAAIMGTKYSPVCWTNSCDYFLTVPSPANSTITDISTSFTFQTIAACNGSDGGFNIDYAACRFPSAAPGVQWCNLPGSTLCQWYNVPIPEFNACFPAPSCSPQNLDFTLHFYRCNTDPDTNCSLNCVRAYDPWVMYVSGRTLEMTYFTPSMQICGGTSVDLIAVPEFGVPPYSFLWNFSASTNDTINVTPVVTSYYSVSVTDACGSNVLAYDTISVEPNTNPGFIINPITACVNENITLSGNGSAAVSDYDWVVPGSNISGGIINDNQTPILHYTLPGTYNVTLRFFNANCLYFDSTLTIVISAQSVPDVILNTSIGGPYCLGDTLHFNASPANGGIAPTYDWIVDGILLQSGVVDTFSTAQLVNGSIVQVVLHSNSLCVTSSTDTASTFIALNSAVVPDVTIQPDTGVCPGSPVTFTVASNNSGATPSYQWYVNGIVIGGATTTSFSTIINAGDSLITVQMNSSLRCVVSPLAVDTSLVVQLQNLSPAIILSFDVTAGLCSGDTVHFIASSDFGGSTPLFQWFVNGVSSSAATGDSTYDFVIGISADSISVQLSSSYACLVNNTANDYEIVQGIISLLPSVTIATNPSVVCVGNPLNFIAQPHYGGVSPTFDWYLNGQNGGSNDIYSPGVLDNGDSVSVTMNSSVPCAIQSQVNNSFIVNNLPSPIANFSYVNPAPGSFLNQVSFLNTSIDANSWVWYFTADSDTSFTRNPIHIFPGQGTYEVTLVVGNNFGCFDSITYNVIVQEDIAVYVPRAFTPNGDNINEVFQPIGASLNEYEFNIFNRWGEIIFTGNEKKPWPGTVKDSAVPAPEGVYVYHLEAKGLELEERIVNGRVTLIR